MKFILLLFILIGSTVAAPRASCLKANDICDGSDFSVADLILCGTQPDQNFSVDANIIAPKGSGFMRKPEQCDGLCVDVMSKEDKNKLKCTKMVNTPIWNCSNYKSSKQCVTDIGGWIGIGGAVLVVFIIVGCWITNKRHSENCQDEIAAEEAAKEKAKRDAGVEAAKAQAALANPQQFKPMKIGRVPNYYQ